MQEVKESSAMKKRMKKMIDFITRRYGSIYAFKLLKYLLEHKLARESKGFAVYEISFNIAPSEVLTAYALVRIECVADDAEQKEAEDGLSQLLKKGIVKVDKETNIIELNVPVDSVANVFLREVGSGLEVVADRSLADIILLPTSVTRFSKGKKNPRKEAIVAGVPDILEKNKRGKYTMVEIKLGTRFNG